MIVGEQIGRNLDQHCLWMEINIFAKTNSPLMKQLLIIVFLLIATESIAQKSDVGNWLIYFGNKQINKKMELVA